MQFREFTGKTVEDAIKKGLAELNVAREDVEIRVLEEGKKKLFGSIPAKVEIGVIEVEPVAACEEKGAEETDGERAVASPACHRSPNLHGQRELAALQPYLDVVVHASLRSPRWQ